MSLIEFRCVGYISLTPSCEGALIPIFLREGMNVSFIQEVDRDYTVSALIPYYNDEEFRFISSIQFPIVNIGSSALFAYNNDDRLVETSVRSLIGTYPNGPVFTSSSLSLLTRLQLLRFVNAKPSEIRAAMESFLDSFDISLIAKNTTMRGQLRTLENSSAIWDEIENINKNDVEDIGAEPFSKNAISGLSDDELFQWLLDNELSQLWLYAAFRLADRKPFDERLFDILAKMCASDEFVLSDASDTELYLIRVGIELIFMSKDSPSMRDFGDGLFDFVMDGTILGLRSQIGVRNITSLIDWMATIGILNGFPVDVYIDLLRSEVIDREFAIFLIELILLESDTLRSPVRQHDSGMTRIEQLQALVSQSGRLGLVVPVSLRRAVMSLAE